VEVTRYVLKTPQTVQEIEEAVRMQVGFLQKSCSAFDDGDTAESARIATSLRILLHQSRTSHALLEQLGANPMNTP
jgi:hypothetical protein